MRCRALLIASLTFLTCFGSGTAQTPSPRERAYNVSLIRIIANPKTFDDRRLRVAGYLGYNGVDRALGIYVTEVDGQNGVLSNSVDLRLETSSADKLIGKYVIFDGTYHAPSGALADYYNGYFDHISELKALHQGDLPK